MHTARLRSVLFVVAFVAASLTSPAALAGAPPGPVVYIPPVDAPISDPFRPPDHAYGPGNRGIEYATNSGDVVRAVAAGQVTFAGPVGGTLHVTVLHTDGLRSTVSFVETIAVRRGETVQQGQQIATAGGRTHLGVRTGEEYLDPATLFVPPGGRVRLVPTETAQSSTAAAERAAIASWKAAQPRRPHDRAADWLRTRAIDAAATARQLSAVLDPTGFVVGTGLELFDRLTADGPCTSRSQAVPPPERRRVVVLVGGLGSTSDAAAVDRVDVRALGYESADVYRFSYAGGRVPDAEDRHQRLSTSSYDAMDSQGDLAASAERLVDLIDDLAGLESGVPIDIISHSQGGVVARLALDGLHRSGNVESLGAVVTLGTPHQGADLASAAAAVRSDAGTSRVFGAVDDVLGTDLDLGAASVRQLAVSSPLTTRLVRQGVPDDVHFTSIGARGDLVVAASRTRVEGATNVTISLSGLAAHDSLPSDAATTREIGLSLTGAPPTCESTRDRVLDVVGGRLVSRTHQALAAGILLGGLAAPG